MAYKNGDAVFAEDINKAIDDSTTAVNTANTAKTASDKASTDVVELAKQIGTKQGTTVTVGGVAQANVAFTSDPQMQIDEKLNIGKVTRTATVVVGLEASGYTENQVDVLIKTTDNVVSKINEAIGKLPAIGGEIKFLEGTYIVESVVHLTDKQIIINSCNSVFKTAPGQINIFTLETPSTSAIFMNSVFENTSSLPNRGASIGCQGCCMIMNCKFIDSGYNIYVSPTAKLHASNCLNIAILGIDASNWENIWIDGVASSPDGSITKWQDGRMEIIGRIDMTNEPTFKTITLPIAFNGGFRVFACALLDFSSYGTNDCAHGQFNFYREMPAKSNYFNYLAIGRWK